MFLLVVILIVLIFLYGVRAYFTYNSNFWKKQGVLEAKVEDFKTFWKQIGFTIPFHEKDNILYQKFKSYGKNIKFGGIMEFRRPVAFAMDPDFIKSIMVKDFDSFSDRRLFGAKNDPTLFDKTLFSMTNPEWKDVRATMSPTFTTGKIRKMFSIFNESSEKMAVFLKTETDKCSEIDFRDVAGRYTMDVIASSAFGVDSQNFENKNSTFATTGIQLQNQFSGWFGTFKLLATFLAPWIYSVLRLSFLDPKAFDFFKDVVTKTMKHRELTGDKRNDFLQLIMETRSLTSDDSEELDQPKAKKIILTDDLIVAQCILFFLAGFDTTESLLIFAAYELALNPTMQQRLRRELREATDKTDGKLTYDIINELEYLDMVVSETLRKYPPVVRTERVCTEEFQVPDSKIKFNKDQLVIAPVWSIHHDADFYPDPEKFIPERFSKENKNLRNPYTYMPFGVGPRQCIAMRFALSEGKAAIAHLLQNFVLEPSAKTPIPMQFHPIQGMKPINGMWLKISPIE